MQLNFHIIFIFHDIFCLISYKWYKMIKWLKIDKWSWCRSSCANHKKNFFVSFYFHFFLSFFFPPPLHKPLQKCLYLIHNTGCSIPPFNNWLCIFLNIEFLKNLQYSFICIFICMSPCFYVFGCHLMLKLDRITFINGCFITFAFLYGYG